MPDIEKTVEVIRDIVQAVPVYEDAIQPAARELGQALGTVAGTVRVALAPLRIMVWGLDQIENWVYATLSDKLQHVPPERIVPPEPTIAGPILEAMRFAGENPTLRELYANLLATSMDEKTVRNAHPAFVEIIRQLTPDEARIVSMVAKNPGFAVLSVKAKSTSDRGYTYVLRNFSTIGEEAGCAFPDLTPSYLTNLSRLGLVEIPFSMSFQDEKRYSTLNEHPRITSIIEHVEGIEGATPTLEKGVALLTEMGHQFCQACVITHDAQVESGC